jgi:hypothetical protein
VFRSIDNGESWTHVAAGPTATFVLSLAAVPRGSVFAGTYFGGGMFRSIDNGETGTEQNNGFTAVDVNALAINSSGHVFAAANGGAFQSTTDGESWTDISGGLIPLGGAVSAVAIDAQSHALAGTAGGGVFRSAQPTETGPPIVLEAVAQKTRGTWSAQLTWSGAPAGQVDVYRNGQPIATVPDVGAYADSLGKPRKGTVFVYVVCHAGTAICSNEASVTIGTTRHEISVSISEPPASRSTWLTAR